MKVPLDFSLWHRLNETGDERDQTYAYYRYIDMKTGEICDFWYRHDDAHCVACHIHVGDFQHPDLTKEISCSRHDLSEQVESLGKSVSTMSSMQLKRSDSSR